MFCVQNLSNLNHTTAVAGFANLIQALDDDIRLKSMYLLFNET